MTRSPAGSSGGGSPGNITSARALAGAFGSIGGCEPGFRGSSVLSSHMHIAPGLYGSNRNCGQVVDSNWPDWTQSPIGVSGLSLPNFRVQREGSVVAVRALAKEAARPSLDDVERLSKGKPSKAKIGSRAVPHRLTLAERKVSRHALERRSCC